MSIHRFFIAPQYIDETRNTVICRSAKLVRQIRKVLRLDNGDRIDVLDGRGNVYHCQLENVSNQKGHDFLQARIVDKEINYQPGQAAGIKFTIALPLIRINRFEWALEKLTELGVDKIVPVLLHRSRVKDKHHGEHTTEVEQNIHYPPKNMRWQKIIEEATEQCGRTITPELALPIAFLDWLPQIEPDKKNTLRIICTERKAVPSLEEVLCNRENSSESSYTDCAIAIGAEGGFTEKEIEAALVSNFIPVSLGSLILRSETAAIYTLSIIRSVLVNQQSP